MRGSFANCKAQGVNNKRDKISHDVCFKSIVGLNVWFAKLFGMINPQDGDVVDQMLFYIKNGFFIGELRVNVMDTKATNVGISLNIYNPSRIFSKVSI